MNKSFKQQEVITDTCSGCQLNFYRCTDCKNYFQPEETAYCDGLGGHYCLGCAQEDPMDKGVSWQN